jgi:Mrp family chromosome partitioning ATPase
MIEPINFGAALRRSWRLLLVLAVVFAIVAVLVPVSGSKGNKGQNKQLKYSATTTVATPPTSSSSQRAGANSILFWGGDFYLKEIALHQVIPSGLSAKDSLAYINAMSAAPASLTKAAKTSNKPLKPGQAYTATLTAEGPTPELAAKLTNAYSLQVGGAIRRQYQQAQQAAAASKPGNSTTSTTVPSQGNGVYLTLLPALANSATKIKGSKSSITSSRKIRLLAGAVIGLVVGSAVVLIRELLDKRLRTAGGSEGRFKYPVLVELPAQAWKRGFGRAPAVVEIAADPGSSAAEAYRMLRMSVMFESLAPEQAKDTFDDGLAPWPAYAPEPYKRPEPGTRQVVLVVSAGSEPTRPIVSANLGAAYGEAGQRVIVVSTGDLASGYAAGAATSPSDIGPAEVAAQLLPSSLENVSRLSLRHFVANSGQLVTHAPAILGAARQLADVVIVEAPPLLTMHHGEALVHAVDVVLVVGECGMTSFEQAARTGDLLRRMGAPVLGVVLTEVRLSPREMKKALARAQSHAQQTPPTAAPQDSPPAAEEPTAAQPIPEIAQAFSPSDSDRGSRSGWRRWWRPGPSGAPDPV